MEVDAKAEEEKKDESKKDTEEPKKDEALVDWWESIKYYNTLSRPTTTKISEHFPSISGSGTENFIWRYHPNTHLKLSQSVVKRPHWV